MANSLDETQIHQSFRSPTRRRRSTFFERRDSVAPQALSESVDDVCKNITETDKRFNEMSRYYERLMTEKEHWKKETKERQSKYHDLRQQYILAKKAPKRSIMSYASLTNEDIEFLKAKPKISNLIGSQQEFHNSLKETMTYARRVNQLEEVALDFCEARVNKVTEYILEHSTVEPMD